MTSCEIGVAQDNPLKGIWMNYRRTDAFSFHCGSGKRASLAASFLLTQGFDAVHIDGVCDECERIAEARGVAH
jgi:rhodanese-related sulfurtransferase